MTETVDIDPVKTDHDMEEIPLQPISENTAEHQVNVDEVKVEEEIIPAPSSHPEPVSPAPTPELPISDIPKTEQILNQVAKELKSLLASNKLTLSNLTGVVVDLYNFVQSYKSLTENQKTLLLITALTNFVKTEVDADQTLLIVIESLVPRIVDTLVGVSTGKINIGDIVEEIEEKARGCWSAMKACFKKH